MLVTRESVARCGPGFYTPQFAQALHGEPLSRARLARLGGTEAGASNVQRDQPVRHSLRIPLTILLLALLAGLAGLLVWGAWRTYRTLNDQQAVFLRSQAASVASQLETAREADLTGEDLGLLGLKIFDRPTPELSDLWEGRELFRAGTLEVKGDRVFRAYVPFHGPDGLRVARIDLDAGSADFLIADARRHLWTVGIGAAAMLALAMVAAWSLRRQVELQHLAHIGEMSAVLAHEIRNPLGTIKGFAQLLGERASPADAALIEPILSETTRLEDLVKDLLLYGRPAQPVPSLTSTGQIVESVRIHARHPEWLAESSGPDVTFSTDPNLVQQALLNLLRNAEDAVEKAEHPRIWLSVEAAGEEMVFRVMDNGPGFPQEVLARLAEPFYTTKASGTGLGLSISRKLARALGGSLAVRHREGGGACVELRLPRRNR